MEDKAYKLMVLALMLFIAPIAVSAKSKSEAKKEYQVKAAFLYNFVKFVDWPKEKITNSGKPIVIGIIGDSPFGDLLEPIKKRQVKGREIIIRQFKSFKETKKAGALELKREIEALKKCHLLYICSSEKKNISEIIETLKEGPVLTVRSTSDSIKVGGIIRFMMLDNKVCFEINVAAAEQANLKIRSQLLRLAKRVVKENTAFKS